MDILAVYKQSGRCGINHCQIFLHQLSECGICSRHASIFVYFPPPRECYGVGRLSHSVVSFWKFFCMKAFPIHHHFGQQLNALLPGPYQFETCGILCSKLAPSDARLCTHRSFGLLTLQVWWVSSARRQTRCKHLEPSNQWMSEWHFESRTPFGWTFAASWHTELTSVLNFSIYTRI